MPISFSYFPTKNGRLHPSSFPVFIVPTLALPTSSRRGKLVYLERWENSFRCPRIDQSNALIFATISSDPKLITLRCPILVLPQLSLHTVLEESIQLFNHVFTRHWMDCPCLELNAMKHIDNAWMQWNNLQVNQILYDPKSFRMFFPLMVTRILTIA